MPYLGQYSIKILDCLVGSVFQVVSASMVKSVPSTSHKQMVDLDASMLDLAAGRTPHGSFSELLEAAKDHQLASLLAYRCGPADSDALAYLKEAAVREMRLASFQTSLIRHLAAVGVPAWPYKGPTLRALINSPAPRESGDVDLLVQPEHIDKAYQTLLVGREPYGPGPDVRPIGLRRDAAMKDLENGHLIEIHWALAASCWRFTPERMVWDELESAGKPSNELLFSILAHHGVAHGFFRLKWLNDLVALSQSPSWSLPSTLDVADQCGARLAVDVSLVLMNQLLGFPLPSLKPSRRAIWIAELCGESIRRRMSDRHRYLQLRVIHLMLVPDKIDLIRGIIDGRRIKHLYPAEKR